MTKKKVNDQVDSNETSNSQFNGEASLDKDTSSLFESIDKQQAEIQELKSLAQQTQADFINYRKRTEQDLNRAKSEGAKKIVIDLLDTFDIIDTAFSNIPTDIQDNEWVKGLSAVRKKMLESITKIGLTKLELNEGDEFDHNTQEAIDDDGSDGERAVVAVVLRSGYIYKGELIRPAMVRVTHCD